MSEYDKLLKYFVSETFFASILTVVFAGSFLYIIKQYLIKKVAYTTKDEQHKNTLVGVAFSIMQYVVVILAVVLILKLHGVNVTSILAGLGIVATIVGLALQDTLKDIIAGVSIYNNNFYKVGDLIRYNGEECDVKYFNARVTKLQSIQTNSTYTVNNSLMTSVEKIKDAKIQRYMFDFDVEKEKVAECLTEICTVMKKECKHVKDIYYDGINDIDDKGVLYEIKYKCPAHKHEIVRDTLMKVSYDKLKEHGLKPKFNSVYK